MKRNVAFLCLAILLSITPVYAEDVILHPGNITGTVTVGSEPINYIYASAYGGSYSASTNSYTNNYALIVEGGSWTYTVSASAYMNNWKDYMTFPSQTATVAQGATTYLDFNVDPGYITGTVTVTGGTLTGGTIYTYTSSGSSWGYSQINSDGTFRIPVYPDSNVQVYGSVSVNIGGTTAGFNLPYKYVSVTSGATTTVDWELSVSLAGGAPGNISGNINVDGVSGTISHSIYGYGPSTDPSGNPYPWQSYASAYRSGNGAYSLTNLNPGSWNMYASSYFPDYQSSISHPYSTYTQYVTVPSGGDVVNNNFGFTAGLLKGSLILSGTASTSDLYSASVSGNGIYGNESYGGSASSTVNKTTGAYDMVLAPGDWDVYYVYMNFYNASSYQYNYLYVYDYTKYSYYGTPVSVNAGQTVSNHDFNFQTGTVTIRFTVADGGTLRSPYISGSNLTYNNGVPATYTYVYAYGSSAETTLGEVKLITLPGTYNFDAYAYVGASWTKFGSVSVEVLPGTEIIVDIGGPTLTIENPTPEYYTTGSNVVVSGKATDDTGVANVTVNGNLVTLTSTGNPSDPNEVSFSTTIALNYGPNQITTVATDITGKIASDSRVVYRDSGPPTIVWTPADGTITSASSITVSGTATDDNEITKTTVNGVSVPFALDTTTPDPNDVTFSTTVSLAAGDNPINVAATDNSKRTTTQTHTVTKSINQPLVADAGGPYTGNEGSPITFSAAGSTGPDGDTLNYRWDFNSDGTWDTGWLNVPTASYTWNDNYSGTVTVEVTDGTFTDTDTASVTVNNVAPTVNAGADQIANEGDTVSFSGSYTDPGINDAPFTVQWNFGDGATASGTLTPTHVYADNGVYTVTLAVTDKDGGTGTDTLIVTVNNVAPTVTLDKSYYATVPITLRIAGQGKVGNSVALEIIQDGVVLASDKITRTPGSPDEQEATISATLDLSKPYSGRLIFDTEAAISGGTPVWVIIDGNMSKVTTFNTQKNNPSSYHQTYDFTLAGLFSLAGKELTFRATASDPGTDGMTFDWDFGDGSVLSNPYPWGGSHTVTDTVKHIYAASGPYTVNLKVTDDDGGVGSDSKTI